MHLPPHNIPHHPSLIPTIPVCDVEVPLPTYFQVTDLYNAGHNVDSIIVHMVATTQISNIDILRTTVKQIGLNLQLISNSANSLVVSEQVAEKSAESRRNSRIEFVGELDDLSSAGIMAEGSKQGREMQREKEGRRLKGLLARLG